MAFPGSELYYDTQLGLLERWYCRLFGAPVVGLRIRVRRLKRLLPDAAEKVLDAGCGRGVIARMLEKKYGNGTVHAIDADQAALDRSSRIAGAVGLGGCEFIRADLLEYEKPDYYDLIVSVDNLEHIEDDEKVLRNFFRSLVEGGRLVVHVPHYYRRWPAWKWRRNFDVPGHVRPGYHLAELVERVRRAGFSVAAHGFSYGFLENVANNISYAITGAKERHKLLYALVFPGLNFVAWLGQWARPSMGAGVWVIAVKPEHAVR